MKQWCIWLHIYWRVWITCDVVYSNLKAAVSAGFGPTWISAIPAQWTFLLPTSFFFCPAPFFCYQPDQIWLSFIIFYYEIAPLHYSFMQFFCSVAARWYSFDQLLRVLVYCHARSPMITTMVPLKKIKKDFKCPEGILTVIKTDCN